MSDGGTQETQTESSDDERELEKLESDVNEMATKIADYRDTLPNQLTATLDSLLTAQRPLLPSSFDVGSDTGLSGHSASGGTFLHLYGCVSLFEVCIYKCLCASLCLYCLYCVCFVRVKKLLSWKLDFIFGSQSGFDL